jgi:adenylyltransferase/sulfurtransferase
MSAMSARERALQPAQAHVLLVGAGGIGCPAAWALLEAGLGRLTVVDPDLVEPSNLPRQVLFGPQDVGRPKAVVLEERLKRHGVAVHGHPVRLDHTNEEALVRGVDLVLDATDGARTKDWLSALAVRRRVPLVHAAGLRSEGRVLDVPVGGRPCLACLFGRVTQDDGSCADLGVWNGVVGAVGFLAAATALGRLAAPRAPSRGYVVLDLEGGRAVTLSSERSPDCPVCGDGADPPPERYPDPLACAPGQSEEVHAADALDLVGEECPLNLLRARRAVEDLPVGRALRIVLGAEGAATVPGGLRALGHEILAARPLADGGLDLDVRCGRRRVGEPLPPELLERFSRQVVLPDFTEAGQQKLLASSVALDGSGPVQAAAAMYLAAAGVGTLVLRDEGWVGGQAGRFPFPADAGGQRRAEALARALDGRSVGRVTTEVPATLDVLAFPRGERERGMARIWKAGAWPPARVMFDLGAAGTLGARVVRLEADGERAHPPPGIGGPAAYALGALLADAILRELVLGRSAVHEFGVTSEACVAALEAGA